MPASPSPTPTPSRADILRSAGEINPANLRPDGPWGETLYPGKRLRALTTDGIVRSVQVVSHADTFFSVPARVSVRGRTITGYLSVSTIDGSDVSMPDDPAVLTFRAYRYGKNADALPAEPVWRENA